MQTETAYWQPNPNATVPFTANPQIYDPVFPTAPFNASDLPGVPIPNADGWGLRAVNSTLLIYGAGESCVMSSGREGTCEMVLTG